MIIVQMSFFALQSEFAVGRPVQTDYYWVVIETIVIGVCPLPDSKIPQITVT